MTLGENIKSYRQARGMTLRYLAAEVGVSFQFLHMLEKGTKHGTDKLAKFAEVLGVDVSDLTGDDKKTGDTGGNVNQ